jgi:pyruvate/2-oxoglutarate dehydrogenase complex dihydrolipoamide dehydrogenase (E3) component
VKPWELESAELIDGLCQRYGCLPSQLLAEDATIMRMLAVVQLGQPEQHG